MRIDRGSARLGRIAYVRGERLKVASRRLAVIPDCQDGPKCGGLPTKIALPRFSAEFPVGLRCGQFAGNHANGPAAARLEGATRSIDGR